MKVLLVHNAYRERGGEDTCVTNEIMALKSAGVEVTPVQIQTGNGLSAIKNAALGPWGAGEEGHLEAILRGLSADVVHAHNLYPLFSARLFKAAKERGIKTVQTLHNFRPICLNGLFMTPHLEICERCTPENHWPGIIRGCYRDSRIQSMALAAHLSLAARRHWYEDVDVFISPSQFLKRKYEQQKAFHGRIVVQGHFVPFSDLAPPRPASPYVLYLGRLSEEKGIRWILELFQKAKTNVRLIIAGDGPLLADVLKRKGETIAYAGYVSGKSKEDLLTNALAVVMPSECYENFPMALAEAHLRGVPGLVPDHGGLGERVQPGVNGELYQPRQADSFWSALERIQEKSRLSAYRSQCQRLAMEEFSQDRFLKRRLDIYQSACTVGTGGL